MGKTTLSFIALLRCPETTCRASNRKGNAKRIISFHIYINPCQRSLFFIAAKTILMLDYKKPSRKNSKKQMAMKSRNGERGESSTGTKNENTFSEFSTFETKELYQTLFINNAKEPLLHQVETRKTQANFSIHFSIDIYGLQSIYPLYTCHICVMFIENFFTFLCIQTKTNFSIVVFLFRFFLLLLFSFLSLRQRSTSSKFIR